MSPDILTVLGDSHGNDSYIQQFVVDCENTPLVLGDLGFGFAGRELTRMENPVFFQLGNHDSRSWVIENEKLLKEHNWFRVPNGVHDNVLYIDGGFSPDYKLRVQGVNFFEDEEISNQEMNDILDELEDTLFLDAVVTHSVPLKSCPHFGLYNPHNTRTGQFLQHLVDNVLIGYKKPPLWLHGHMHTKLSYELSGIPFRCISPLGTGDRFVLRNNLTFLI